MIHYGAERLPKFSGRVVERAAEQSPGLSHQWNDGVRIQRQRRADGFSGHGRTVGELNGDWFCGTCWNRSIQVLDCLLCFSPSIVANESNALRKTYAT